MKLKVRHACGESELKVQVPDIIAGASHSPMAARPSMHVNPDAGQSSTTQSTPSPLPASLPAEAPAPPSFALYCYVSFRFDRKEDRYWQLPQDDRPW